MKRTVQNADLFSRIDAKEDAENEEDANLMMADIFEEYLLINRLAKPFKQAWISSW